MAQFTIVVPDDKVNGLVNAFAKQYSYQDKISDPETGELIDNPMSKASFAKNIIKQFVKEVYVAAQVKELEATRVATVQQANTDIAGVDVN